MKRSLISMTLAALVTTGVAMAQSTSSEGKSDRYLPTYPELGFDGWRNNAGESEMDNKVQVQIADGYRFNAGESTQELVVQDVGSA